MRALQGVFIGGVLAIFAAPVACSSSDGGSDQDATAGSETGPVEDTIGVDTIGRDTNTPPGTDSTVPPGDAPPGTDTNVPPVDAPGLDTAPGTTSAATIAIKLRGKSNFLIGMGNDLAGDHTKDGVYTLGPTLDLHYAYLVGLPGSGGWPDWNAGGSFVNLIGDVAVKKGVTPMYTLYAMAAWGDGNTATVTDDAFMKPYWDGAKLLFQRVALLGKPAVVHLEPDWWGYAQQFAKGDPKKMPVHVTKHAPDCAGLPDDVSGMARCLIKLARTYAPTAVIGFGVSEWGGDTASVVAWHKALGATEADIAVLETLDRDAGCFEAGTDPNCKRGGSFYWDETNTKSPNPHEALVFAKAVHDGLGKPLLWWQTPFGVPSTTAGGTAGHYRDNRVHYMFAHIDEFIAAGGLGITFGTGAGNQTYIDTDGGQFKTAVTKYFSAPTPLP